MMENREYLNSLFDIYAYLLTKTEQETFEDYYMEDLSLQELADNKNISKSSVGKTLKSAIEKLEEYETILHNYKTKTIIEEILLESDINRIKEKIKNILENM